MWARVRFESLVVVEIEAERGLFPTMPDRVTGVVVKPHVAWLVSNAESAASVEVGIVKDRAG